MDTAPKPRKRATESDRDNTAKRLQDAFADGQLSITEFDERSRAVYAATYADELPVLIQDLSPVEQPQPAVESRASHAQVSGEPGGSAFSVSLMGGSERTGEWLIAPTHTSLTLMGGNSLDLRKARFSGQETMINALAVMGGIEIIVPDDIRIVDSGAALMGGFGIEDHHSCTISRDDLPASAPVLHIRGCALMGGVGIVRAARGARV